MTDYKNEFKVKSEELLAKIKELIHEGNVRRIIIKDEEGKVFFEIPVTFGLIGALLAPTLAAVGAIAAMVANFKIEVIRTEEPPKKEEKEKSASATV
ncbi:MAG TPA: DUF4342 domain-containing protein [Bacteroidales bacterium]|nr:DUF4342 domain-containing protein [Bacteroidales bacterium]